MLKTKIISSLENVFVDEGIESYTEINRISALRGERLSIQFIYRYEDAEKEITRIKFNVKAECELLNFANLYDVHQVPVIKPIFHFKKDENYLRTTPGLFPDLLAPRQSISPIFATHSLTNSLWIEIKIPEDSSFSGEYPLNITLTDENGTILSENSIVIDIIPIALPEQKLIFTQWFHADCLAEYYAVPVWSKRHWEIIESYAKTAVYLGVNTLLTPVFTPPLDTAVGGERLTTQLVEVKLKDGKYSFSWKQLDKWIDMCNRIGIKYLEISHLFTQWGATHAPKIIATVDGKKKQIFGWETDAHGEEYRIFIRAFLKALLAHLKRRGDDKRCLFHISDEPTEEQLEDYKKSKNVVADILDDYIIMDALSSYDFYEKGVVKTPIPSSDHIAPFIENKVENLWTYYFCGQCIGVSNRLISMPSFRNRSIGMQMYKYNIVGFLHWGFNFYNSEHSISRINPFVDLSGDKWVPAGDPFSVYPSRNGEAKPSLRALVFYDALQDIRAMQLCEALYSHDEVVAAAEKALGYSITFDRCAKSANELLCMRETVNAMIKEKTDKKMLIFVCKNLSNRR